MEAVILAGGKGTRLKSIIKDLPKPLANVNGRPFLEYLMDKLINNGCEHFNPYNKNHGSLNSVNSHAGDLGNIISKHGICKGIIETNKISIIPGSKNSIIGRMIIVHEDEDDLALGNNKESLITGNAGKRLACGIIGIKEGY